MSVTQILRARLSDKVAVIAVDSQGQTTFVLRTSSVESFQTHTFTFVELGVQTWLVKGVAPEVSKGDGEPGTVGGRSP